MSETHAILLKIENVRDLVNSPDKENVLFGLTLLKGEDWYKRFIASCQDEAITCPGFYRMKDIDKKIDSLLSREFSTFSLLWDDREDSYLKRPILLLLNKVTIFYQEKQIIW